MSSYSKEFFSHYLQCPECYREFWWESGQPPEGLCQDCESSWTGRQLTAGYDDLYAGDEAAGGESD